MKKSLWLIGIVIVSGMMITSLHSFFLPKLARYTLSDTEHASELLLNYAKYYNLPDYHHYIRKTNVAGSAAWLNSTINLAKEHATFSLELGNYFYENKDQVTASLWWQQAKEQGSKVASYYLATLLYDQGKYRRALNILPEINEGMAQADIENVTNLTIKLALRLGEKHWLQSAVKQLQHTNEKHELLVELANYGITIDISYHEKQSESCFASLQMFATTLEDLRYLSGLIEDVQGHYLSGYICFKPLQYIPYDKLGCSHKPEEAIRCKKEFWLEKIEHVNSDYIGVLVPKGGANVDNGMLYLDRFDTADVLSHELSHLLGFIDEYPLPANHAKCLASQKQAFSHNVVVLPNILFDERVQARNWLLTQLPWAELIDETTPVLTKGRKGWHIGTPSKYNKKIGVFASRSCDGNRPLQRKEQMNIKAFKPIHRQTQLEYFELSFPSEYRAIFELHSQRFLMKKM